VRAAIALLLICASLVPADGASSAELRAAVAKQYAALHTAQAAAVKGKDGWYFLSAELRSYSLGKFWGPEAAAALDLSDDEKNDATVRAKREKDADPLATIVAFDAMLKKAGIPLLLVPVPGKICIYPDKLDPALTSAERWDDQHQALLGELAKAGVQVIDLVPDLRTLRAKGMDSHCRQDSHWSPQAMQLASQRIAAMVKAQPWYAGAAKQPVTRAAMTVEVRGDLAGLLKDESEPKEKLAIEQIQLAGAAVDGDLKSPVVLMGDSHTLVFHGNGLLAEHAGLPDHLAAELGLAVDLTGVLGSGANGSRMALARRKDNLAGKQCVVWVFTARELSESQSGWKAIPVIR